MAKRRILKKNISYVAGELFTDAMLCSLFIKDVNKEAIETVMGRIIDMEEAFIRRVSHTDAKDNKTLVKEYYRKLFVDLQEEADAIGKELEELTKEKN